MNVFILDESPEVNVKSYIDKHVVKMITEHVQLLSTTLHFVGKPAPYRSTHINHPAAKWTRLSASNFSYLWNLTDLLGQEYTYRYGKAHMSHLKLLDFIPNKLNDLDDLGLTPFVNCTPYKEEIDVVKAYRMFYNNEKSKFASWKNRPIPEWFLPVVDKEKIL